MSAHPTCYLYTDPPQPLRPVICHGDADPPLHRALGELVVFRNEAEKKVFKHPPSECKKPEEEEGTR